MTTTPDLFDTLAGLPSPANYTEQDLYRDFRLVFFGSDEGKRVLRRILELGYVFSEPKIASPIDPYMLAQIRGRRWLALKVLDIAQFEPPQRPIQSKRKREVNNA